MTFLKSIKFIKEMFDERKYIIFSEEEFKENNIKHIILWKNTENKNGVAYFVHNCLEFKDVLKKILQKYDLITIVYEIKHNNTFKKLKDIEDKIEFFTLQETQYNITKHFLQPKFSIALEQKKDFYPVISKYDIITRYYRFPINTIIKVTNEHKITYSIIK